MEKELTIGILRLTAGWQTILNQAGVSFAETSTVDDFSPDKYSLLIVNRPVTNKEFENIQSYVKNGGAILDTGFCITSLNSGSISMKKCGVLFANNLPFEFPCGAVDIYSQVSTYSKAQYLNNTLFIGESGNGLLSFLGLDVDTLLFDTRSKRKEFYGSPDRPPHEEGACVSKGDITRLIFFLIKHLHLERSIPFIHKWFFPGDAENVFLFRIDSDFGTQKQIQHWYKIAEPCNIRYTWFLHVAAHEKWLDTFSSFHNHEIAVHGYDHITTKKTDSIKHNIGKALKILKEHGFSSLGHGAPYGLWSTTLQNVCEEYGFIYSSEFSYVYDSLPLYPAVNNQKSSVLQIPVHPICIGSLLNVNVQKKDILDYFTGLLQRQMIQHNPLILYDHVLHDQTDVLQEIFMQIEALSLPRLTFLEFARWWINREKILFKASMDGEDTIKISSPENGEDLFFCIWTRPDTYILTNAERIQNISSQLGRKHDYSINYDISKLRKLNKFKWQLYKNSLINKIFWRKYR